MLGEAASVGEGAGVVGATVREGGGAGLEAWRGRGRAEEGGKEERMWEREREGYLAGRVGALVGGSRKMGFGVGWDEVDSAVGRG